MLCSRRHSVVASPLIAASLEHLIVIQVLQKKCEPSNDNYKYIMLRQKNTLIVAHQNALNRPVNQTRKADLKETWQKSVSEVYKIEFMWVGEWEYEGVCKTIISNWSYLNFKTTPLGCVYVCWWTCIRVRASPIACIGTYMLCDKCEESAQLL